MQFRLRTLLIVLALGPPVLAFILAIVNEVTGVFDMPIPPSPPRDYYTSIPPPLTDFELLRLKQRSAELGAPQPVPFPHGFGETKQ